MRPKNLGLKPCPFCGGNARRAYSRAYEAVGCTHCNSQGPKFPDKRHERNDPEKACEAWDRRVPDSKETRPAPSTDVPPILCSCCKQVVKEGYVFQHEGLNLRLCPFCGSAARTVARETGSGNLVCFIECGNCNAHTRQMKGAPEEGPVMMRKIARVWNTRESDYEEAGQ